MSGSYIKCFYIQTWINSNISICLFLYLWFCLCLYHSVLLYISKFFYHSLLSFHYAIFLFIYNIYIYISRLEFRTLRQPTWKCTDLCTKQNGYYILFLFPNNTRFIKKQGMSIWSNSIKFLHCVVYLFAQFYRPITYGQGRCTPSPPPITHIENSINILFVLGVPKVL